MRRFIVLSSDGYDLSWWWCLSHQGSDSLYSGARFLWKGLRIARNLSELPKRVIGNETLLLCCDMRLGRARIVNGPGEFVGKHIQDLFDLSGRIALITGASRGLGLQVAQALGEAGATVVLTSRNQADLEAATDMLLEAGIHARYIAGDASNPVEVERIAQQVIDMLGKVDILVNNAGATWGAPAEDYPLEAWDKVMNLNVRSAFGFSRYIAKHSMIPKGEGRIIMVASVAGLGGNAPGYEMVAYNSSKAALINLGRALAGEWGEFGITVNSLAPGMFPTKMSRATIEAKGMQQLVGRVPLRRLGDDNDLKGAALLFASAAGKHITGQVLAVDGGVSAIYG